MKKALLGVNLDNLNKEDWLNEVTKLVEGNNSGKYLVRPNAEIITYATKESSFKNILNSADLAIPDGVGVQLASKLLNLGIKYRFGGPESMLEIVKLCEEKGFSIYLLGSKVQTVSKASKNLTKQFKNLKIVGYQSGYFTDPALVVEAINKVKPKVVFVGMGFPRQEEWVWENRDKLNVNLLITEGGSFDYLAGEVPHAPEFIRKIGLNWLFRLVIQPWRLKRQTKLLEFIWLVLKAKF